jgi:hypothetical protein
MKKIYFNKVLFVKLCTILFLSGLFPFSSFAQLGGMSGSKISSLTVDVVDHKKVEFEPGFYHFQAKYSWDENSNLHDIYNTADSIKYTTGIYFRVTYGLWDKLEFGISASTDLSAIAIGSRYAFLQKEKWGLAVIAGANIPMGNRTIDQTIRNSSTLSQAGGGIVGSYSFTENFSADMTLQYLHYLKQSSDDDRGGTYLSLDLGYYIFNHQLQLISSFAYRHIANNIGNHDVLTFYPGLTIETGKNYIIVLSAMFDSWGKQEFKNTGFNFALTLTFD